MFNFFFFAGHFLYLGEVRKLLRVGLVEGESVRRLQLLKLLSSLPTMKDEVVEEG